MSLIRYGTRLLLNTSGNLTCNQAACCEDPPPPPEDECWCPNFCAYYWDFPGGSGLPAAVLFRPPFFCTFGFQIDDFKEVVVGNPNDFASNYFYGNVSAFGDIYYGGYLYFEASFTENRKIEKDNLSEGEEFFVQSGVTVGLIIECELNEEGNAVLLLNAYISAWSVSRILRTGFSTLNPPPSKTIYSKYATASAPIECTCINSSALFCDGDPNDTGSKGCHIAGDVGIEWDENGITVAGTPYAWESYEGSDISIGEDWQSDNFPFVGSVTLKRESTCARGECNCNASLAGMEVEFEGQTFIYGDGDSFISEDSSTFWEENPTGTFTRYDREACDNTLNQRVKKAQVVCDNFLDEENNSVSRWFVLLDHDCFERDQNECSPTPVASRLSGWSGAFSCNADGKPVGTPHSFSDSSQPPDVDFETVSDTPAPSGDCSGANAIPQFRFV